MLKDQLPRLFESLTHLAVNRVKHRNEYLNMYSYKRISLYVIVINIALPHGINGTDAGVLCSMTSVYSSSLLECHQHISECLWGFRTMGATCLCYRTCPSMICFECNFPFWKNTHGHRKYLPMWRINSEPSQRSCPICFHSSSST